MTAKADVDRWVESTVAALEPLRDPEHAAGARAYMKEVAPFLGIYSSDRRAAQRAAWSALEPLDVVGIAAFCRRMWTLAERDFQYAACDLLAARERMLPASFVADPVAHLVVTKPWWDTVDALGPAITPVVARNPELVDLMWTWLRSGDRWLVRAAIGHQRGRKEQTDVPRLLAMCDEVADDHEFFVAKAVGWALRDTSRWYPAEVQRFVDDHPQLPTVARREAVRGLVRNRRQIRSARP